MKKLAIHLAAAASIATPSLVYARSGNAVNMDAPAAVSATQACIDVIGPMGGAIPALQSFDGKRLKKPSDIEKARKSVKSGVPIMIEGGNFSKADFRKTKIRNVCFNGSDLSETRWDKSDANGVAFIATNLERANLSGAIMSRVLFRDANLTNAVASRADFSGGKIDGSWAGKLTNFNLDSAQLTAFEFDCYPGEARGCPFDRMGITARGADLTGAKLSSYSFWDLNLQGAKLDRTEINVDSLRLLGGANISGPIYVRGNVHSVTIDQTEVADFVQAYPAATAETTVSCEIEKPQKLDDMLCMNRSGALAKLSQDIAVLEAVDPGITISGARIHNVRVSTCFTTSVANLEQCVGNSLRERREKLAQALGMKTWMKPGEKALFAKIDPAMQAAMGKQPALSRISAPIAGSAPAFVLVQMDSRGIANIRGMAASSTGQNCTLNVASARRWSTNGWYSAAQNGASSKRPVSQPVPIIRMWQGYVEIYPSAADLDNIPDQRIGEFLSCPSANFYTGPLSQLSISDAEFDKMWARLDKVK